MFFIINEATKNNTEDLPNPNMSIRENNTRDLKKAHTLQTIFWHSLPFKKIAVFQVKFNRKMSPKIPALKMAWHRTMMA